MELDIIHIIQGIPFVMEHPYLVGVTGFVLWGVAHLWANVKAPTETSSYFWKTAYSMVNTVVAANYNKAKNTLATLDNPKKEETK
jgi:hypothetical protein